MRRNAWLQKNRIKIGTPAAMKNIIISLGGMAVQSIVNGFGMSFIAGFTATNKLYGLLEIAAISYGYAVTTYVGQNYGAQKTDRMKKGVRSAAFLAVGTSLLIATIMFLFGRNITMLFISADSAELVAAAGNTVVPMISGIVECVMRVGISLFIGYTGYENGIFAAEVAAWIGATIYLYVNYCRISNRVKGA